MRKLIVLPVVLALSACGTAKVHSAGSNPQAQQAEAKGQKLIQECAFSGGKKAIEACLQKHGVTKVCAQSVIQRSNFLTHSGRQAVVVKLEGCAR